MSQNNSNEKAAMLAKIETIHQVDLILRRLLWIIQIWEPERCVSAYRS